MCVCVALSIQHTMRMRHIVICDLPRSTIHVFFHVLSGAGGGGKLLNKYCVLSFSPQLLSETFFILRVCVCVCVCVLKYVFVV